MPQDDTYSDRVKGILLHPETMATILYSIVVRGLGEQVHEWEPETVYLEINERFAVEMPEANFNKVMALISAVASDSFYKSWTSFEIICRSMADGDPRGGEDILVAEMAWGVIEANLNDDTPGQFSPDIAAGVGALLVNEGFTKPPAPLAFADMPEIYQGSSTASDLGREETISTEHAKVVAEFVRDQAMLLVRQIHALPWQTEDSLLEILQELNKLVPQ